MKYPLRQGSFLQSAEDCQWLRDTHLKHLAPVPAFKSAQLWGNDDCPDKVELYAKRNSLITDRPVGTYLMNVDFKLLPSY